MMTNEDTFNTLREEILSLNINFADLIDYLDRVSKINSNISGNSFIVAPNAYQAIPVQFEDHHEHLIEELFKRTDLRKVLRVVKVLYTRFPFTRNRIVFREIILFCLGFACGMLEQTSCYLRYLSLTFNPDDVRKIHLVNAITLSDRLMDNNITEQEKSDLKSLVDILSPIRNGIINEYRRKKTLEQTINDNDVEK